MDTYTNDQDVNVYNFFKAHIEYCEKIKIINEKINKIKKIRQPNFPEVISEYIAKKVYEKLYKKKVKFGKSGDLVCEDKKIEVKAFTSNGPSSFGPTETWDELIFVNATNFKKNRFKVYIINLSNDCEKWKNIKINSKETYNDQCIDGKRPRINFSSIQKKLEDEIELIFEGIIIIEKNEIKLIDEKKN